MLRLAELAVILVPLGAFIAYRVALARGLDGPPPRQLGFMFAVLVALGAALSLLALRERQQLGEYIPAQTVNGEIVPAHVK